MQFAGTPAVQAGHPLAANLVLALPCNEGSGTTAHDVASGLTLTLSGAAGWATGPNGPLLSFPGAATDYSSIPWNTVFDLTGKSFSYYTRLTATGGGTSGYLTWAMLGATGSGSGKIFDLISPGGRHFFRWNSFDSGFVNVQGTTYDVLYTLAATSDTAGTETFYVNGTQVAQQTGTIPAAATGSPFYIGAAGTGSHTFQGTIDLPLLWVNRVLTPTEAASLAADPGAVIRPPSGLLLPTSYYLSRRRKVG